MTPIHYDAIVVGAGAGGCTAAAVLAEAGKSVLLLERGEALDGPIVRDHLRNQRLSQYGHNAGPFAGEPRVAVDLLGNARTVEPWEYGYHNIAACVGGGTRVYGAMAWRFLPDDFRMATVYGVPDGSSLADWPIGYDDLEPYYRRAEWEIGVAGDAAQSVSLWPKQSEYPLPPVSWSSGAPALARGAATLGWPTLPAPLAVNTRERAGRRACIRCQHCVGFPCPTDAKNGAQNTMLPRALATGRCELTTGVMVDRVLTDNSGRVAGIAYFDSIGQRKEQAADVIVLAGGAVETARLLLNSPSVAEPGGIGNATGQVGRHLQGHIYSGATGLAAEPMEPFLGPGPSIATCRFNHGNDGIVGGGLMHDDFVLLPIIYRKRKLPPDVARWGAENKAFMRDGYRRSLDIVGPTQDIPSPDARVTIDPDVRDHRGIPVARLSGTTHPETIRTSTFMADRAEEWLAASGATRIWKHVPTLQLSGGQHAAGTCRMGDDPAVSVVDRHCRVHGHDNLFVADGSVHVTNGGFNPVLTIFALSFRTAEFIVRSW